MAERAGSGDVCDLAGLVSGPLQLYRRGEKRGGGGASRNLKIQKGQKLMGSNRWLQ